MFCFISTDTHTGVFWFFKNRKLLNATLAILYREREREKMFRIVTVHYGMRQQNLSILVFKGVFTNHKLQANLSCACKFYFYINLYRQYTNGYHTIPNTYARAHTYKHMRTNIFMYIFWFVPTEFKSDSHRNTFFFIF